MESTTETTTGEPEGSDTGRYEQLMAAGGALAAVGLLLSGAGQLLAVDSGALAVGGLLLGVVQIVAAVVFGIVSVRQRRGPSRAYLFPRLRAAVMLGLGLFVLLAGGVSLALVLESVPFA